MPRRARGSQSWSLRITPAEPKAQTGDFRVDLRKPWRPPNASLAYRRRRRPARRLLELERPVGRVRMPRRHAAVYRPEHDSYLWTNQLQRAQPDRTRRSRGAGVAHRHRYSRRRHVGHRGAVRPDDLDRRHTGEWLSPGQEKRLSLELRLSGAAP